MAFCICKNCIYGDCAGGMNRSCSEWPKLGKEYLVTDTFFCDRGLSREEAEKIKKSLNKEHKN